MGKVDKTLFIKHLNNDILVVQIYVDDIIFGAAKHILCEEFASSMSQEFEMSLMGELSFILGLQIKQTESGIFISQGKVCKRACKALWDGQCKGKLYSNGKECKAGSGRKRKESGRKTVSRYDWQFIISYC